MISCCVCDSENIEEVRGDWQLSTGQIIPNAWYYHCKDCGECFTNVEMSTHNDKCYEKAFNVKLKESEEFGVHLLMDREFYSWSQDKYGFEYYFRYNVEQTDTCDKKIEERKK